MRLLIWNKDLARSMLQSKKIHIIIIIIIITIIIIMKVTILNTLIIRIKMISTTISLCQVWKDLLFNQKLEIKSLILNRSKLISLIEYYLSLKYRISKLLQPKFSSLSSFSSSNSYNLRNNFNSSCSSCLHYNSSHNNSCNNHSSSRSS